MPKIPVRFRKAFRVACVATVASVILPWGGGGDYSSTVAVLTATLIAVIWYTYWSYVAANREEASYLLLNLHAQDFALTLIPSVANPTRRTLRARVFLDVWADGQPVNIGPLYRGEEPMMIRPGEGWSGAVELTARRQGNLVPRIVCVRWRAAWTNGLDEPGDSGWKHWTVNFTQPPAQAIARLGESEVYGVLQGTARPQRPESRPRCSCAPARHHRKGLTCPGRRLTGAGPLRLSGPFPRRTLTLTLSAAIGLRAVP